MVGRIAPIPTTERNEGEIHLRFGGGINTRASTDEIDDRECCDSSANFDLDLGNTQFRPRLQFDLAWTAPNGGQINGFAQLVTSAGNVTTLIQAGGNIYQTDFSTTTYVEEVSSSARIRGHRHHIWNLTDVVLISDIAGVNPLMAWNGTYLDTVSHNLSGSFIAKYIHIDNERAFFGNVTSNGTLTPHVIVGSQQSDYTVLSTSQKPTSAISASDAFYLVMPDLKPINGMTGAFGVIAISTKRGLVFQLTGASAQDFAMEPLFYDSYADGNESIVFAGNDIVYGRPGRIESLQDTANYGDVESNDLSIKISDVINQYTDWTLAYSSRHKRIYCYPANQPELWVYHKPLEDAQISPWMRWTTQHSFGFDITCMWSMLDAASGLEHVFVGDASGHVYRLEGTGSGGDGNTTPIVSSRISKLVSSPAEAQAYDIQGNLKYRPVTGATDSALSLIIQFQGEDVYDSGITVPITGADAGPVFGGSYYYGDGSVYGSAFEGRLVRTRFAVPGQGNEMQCQLSVSGTDSFQINEVYFGFKASG